MKLNRGWHGKPGPCGEGGGPDFADQHLSSPASVVDMGYYPAASSIANVPETVRAKT